MSDFLTFLNTADLDTLTQVPGISQHVAENLISARPFESADECLEVKGMGKALLGKLELFAEAQGYTSENSSMIQVEEEALPVFNERNRPAQETVNENESFFSRFGRGLIYFLRILLKLILLVILIVVIGAALYYGLPYINKTFIAPVEKNTAQIEKLETEISSLQIQLDEMNTRMETLEKSVEAYTLSIQKLEGMQDELDTKLQENNDKVLLELKHEVMMTRALDMLARARLYLGQSNFGLARTDLQSARDLLAELQSETDDRILAQAITRLDIALSNLPDFPVVASGDLEIAWQILLSGEAPVIPTATFTLTPTPAALDTSTPEPPAPTVTP